MSDYEMVKAGVEAAMRPFADLIEKMAGQPAEELGFMFRDHVKAFRFKCQIRLFKKMKQHLDEAGIEPGRVPLKQLCSILENATVEEDESLQDMWAALLANNAMGKNHEVIFPETLRQLSPADAHLLRNCFQEVMRSPIDRPGGFFYIKRALQEWKDGLNRRHIRTGYPISGLSVENLTRLGLISSNGVVVNGVGDERWLTRIGYALMYACEGPAEIKKLEEQLFKDPRVRRDMNAAAGAVR